MPNFKIIQDQPDQARIQIYGSSASSAISTNASGQIIVTAAADGLSVTGPANGLIVTAAASGLSVTGPANGLIVTAAASGLSVTGPANGLIVTASADGLSITAPTNGLLITSAGLAVISELAVTEAIEPVTYASATTAFASTRQVIDVKDWSFGVVNTGANTADVQLQISPDNATWMTNSNVVAVAAGELGALVSSIFFKYARVSYASPGGNAIGLNIYFQGQS